MHRETITLAILLSLALDAQAQWQVGVGGNPARSSASSEVGPTSGQILWQGSLSGIVAQQGVADGDLVVVNRIQSFVIPTGTWIVAHERLNGAIRWQVQLPMNFADSWRSRVTGLRDGKVYATRSGNTNAEYLYALSVIDGSILWQSTDLVTETTTESVSFTSNGDLVTTGRNSSGQTALLRISHLDGSTVWGTQRSCPTSGGCDAAIFAGKVYYWEASPNGPVISVADVTSGAKLYSSPAVGGGFIQQVGPFVGPDGTVYAPRSQNNPITDFLVAFDDTGSALVERWNVPIGYVPFASHAIGPDGSVYAYSRNLEILRLNSTDGSILDTSAPIPHDFPMQPRMAVDASGKLYLTNGSFASGELKVFTPDLEEVWNSSITNVNVGGPVLAEDGTLVVCGVGTDVRAYRTDCDGYFVPYGTACAGTGGFLPQLTGSGCPSPGQSVTLSIEDALGGAFSILFFGLGKGLSPVHAACDLQINPILSTLVPLALPGSGAGNGDLDLTGTLASSVLPGDVYLQVLVADTGAAFGIAATNALHMHIE
jgi:outer membrane protein assembly factor BamB